MNYKIKKTALFVSFLVSIFFVGLMGAHIAHAGCTVIDPANPNGTYCLLAPIPGLTSSTDGSIDVTNGFGDYINRIIRIFIGLLSVMAVIMIVFGGIQYMISDVAGEKSAGKDRIMNAIWGLVLALASYMLLNTINPDFVHLGIHIPAGTLNQFNSQVDGQDGYNIGQDAGPTVKGNEVVGGNDNHTVTANDPTYLVTDSLGKSLTETNLDYSVCLDANCVFVKHGSGMSDLQLDKSTMPEIESIFAQWRTLKEDDQAGHPYQISSMVGYKASTATGNNALQSPHAFGIAVDIEPTPVDPALVALFTNAGFFWGNTLTPSRPQYFSKLRDEGATNSPGTTDSFKRVTN